MLIDISPFRIFTNAVRLKINKCSDLCKKDNVVMDTLRK